MRLLVEGRARRNPGGSHAEKFLAQPRLDRVEELVKTPGVQHIFQARLQPVGAVAMIDEHAEDGIGQGRAILETANDAGVAGEVAVAADAAQQQAAIEARRYAIALAGHLHRLEADIVGLFQNRHDAAAIKADIELARQAVKRSVVQDMKMELPRQRTGVA